MKINILKKISLVLAFVLFVGIMPLSVYAEKPDVATPPPSANSSKASSTDGKVTTSTKEISVFGFDSSLVNATYKARSGQFTVSPIPATAELGKIISAISTDNGANKIQFTDDQEVEAIKNIEASFLIVFKDGTRRIYSLTSKNYLMAGSERYSISKETYATLLAVYKKDYGLASYAQWLIYMKPSKITEITLESGGIVTVVKEEVFATVVQKIRGLRVTSGTSYSPKNTSFTPTGNNSKITIKFGDEHFYELKLEGTTMYVESDELHIGCKHTIISGDVTGLIGIIKNQDAPATKPEPVVNAKSATLPTT